MVELIADKVIEARKPHRDDSANYIIEAMDIIRHGYLHRGKHIKFKFRELRSIAKLKLNGWNILPGQTYISQFNKCEGELYTFRTLPDIYKICIKHNLYDNY